MKKIVLMCATAVWLLAGCDQQPASPSAPDSAQAPHTEATPAKNNGMLSQLDENADDQGNTVQANTEQDQVVADPDHTSRNALDWNGTYTGILPCASCEGIKTEVVLHKNGTYTLTELYLGEAGDAFEYEGTFNWNTAGNTIALPAVGSAGAKFFVGESQLFRLDQDGNRVTGELAEHYILKKQ
ncbi:copper resistance protein NlpE [Photobacterium japonica]|uniref:copper resistance protein NlpE n=1 Tax=Photobacterium japonica TaxID=2910235 RepID=UPI003D12DC07